MDSGMVIPGASDDAGSSSSLCDYEDSIKRLPDHLRIHYLLSPNGLRAFVFDETTTIVPDDLLHHDRISILPDDLLRHILSFLPTHDAVRTGVLSRRWQRLWIGLRTFSFDDDARSTAGFAGSVDAALAQSHGVDRFEISVKHRPHFARANEWLQLAAERVREKISIVFRDRDNPKNIVGEHDNVDRVVLELPCGGRTASMTLRFDMGLVGVGTLVIPPAFAAAPSSLTQLELKYLRVDASSLSNVVSSCCPRLRKLVVRTFGEEDVLRLSNDSLEDLDLDFYHGGVRRLEVSSRNLRRLHIITIFSSEVMAHRVHDGSKVSSFRTPRLEVLSWTCSTDIHPSRVEFQHSLPTVRQLDVGLMTHTKVSIDGLHNKLALWLLERCTAARCHKVTLCSSLLIDPRVEFFAPEETWLAQFVDLMVEVPQLRNVTDLTVCTVLHYHSYGPSIAKLLSRCSHIEKLTIHVKDERQKDEKACAFTAVCWCERPVHWRQQNLRLDLLRQIDIKGFFTMADWLPDLVSFLRFARPAVLVNYCHNTTASPDLKGAI